MATNFHFGIPWIKLTADYRHLWNCGLHFSLSQENAIFPVLIGTFDPRMRKQMFEHGV
jgi:hypothetical protein